MISETMINASNSTPDCQRKIVWVKGITPVIDRIEGGRLAGLACNCAADDDSTRPATGWLTSVKANDVCNRPWKPLNNRSKSAPHNCGTMKKPCANRRKWKRSGN